MEQQKNLWEQEKKQQQKDRALAGKEVRRRPISLKMGTNKPSQNSKQTKKIDNYPTDDFMRKSLGI